MGSTGAVGGADAERQRHTKMAGQAGHNMGRMLEQAGNGWSKQAMVAEPQHCGLRDRISKAGGSMGNGGMCCVKHARWWQGALVISKRGNHK